MWSTLGILVAIGAWEIIGRSSDFGGAFPPASAVVTELILQLQTADLRVSLALTVSHWLVGLLLSGLIAIPIGLMIGRNRVVERYTASTIDFMRSVPPVVLLPLFILIFGTGWNTVITLSLIGAVWPIMLTVIGGARSVDKLFFQSAAVFRLKPLRIFWSVLLPACAPSIATGIRIGSGITLMVVVVVELLGSVEGIGYFINQAQLSKNYENVFAGILLIGLIGVLANALLSRLEKTMGVTQAGSQE